MLSIIIGQDQCGDICHKTVNCKSKSDLYKLASDYYDESGARDVIVLDKNTLVHILYNS